MWTYLDIPEADMALIRDRDDDRRLTIGTALGIATEYAVVVVDVHNVEGARVYVTVGGSPSGFAGVVGAFSMASGGYPAACRNALALMVDLASSEVEREMA